MKVVISFPYSLNPSGGVETVAYNTIEGLKKIHSHLEREDIFLTILSTSWDKPTGDFSKYPNIDIVQYKPLRPITFVGSAHAYKLNKSLFKNADMIHAHQLHIASAGVKAGTPTLLTLHGMLWREKLTDSNIIRKIGYYDMNIFAFKEILNKLSRFIAISPYVKFELYRIGRHINRISLIENPISDVFFNINKNDVGNTIWYPAVITPRKNQLVMLYAMKYLLNDYNEQIKLVFTGEIRDKEYFLKLKGIIRKLNISKNVELLGKVPYSDLLRLYSASSVVVLLSLQETAPMVISEAFATGTPVVASPVGGVPHMIDHGIDGFLANPNNPRDIAEKIRWILEDRKLQKKMGQRGKQKAMRRWKADVIARELIELYLRVYEEG